MLADSCFLDKLCTRSALNTGWETEAVAQWRWVITEVALVSLLSYQGSSPERTQYLCLICFLFRRWRWKRGGGGRLSRGWIVWEGEKNCSIQWRKWAFLWQVEPPSQHKWKCYRLRGSGEWVRGGFGEAKGSHWQIQGVFFTGSASKSVGNGKIPTKTSES